MTIGTAQFGVNLELNYDTYYFTFGLSSKLVAVSPERPLEPEQQGFPLGNKYVVIHATDEEAARQIMQKHFGLNAWCGCYQASRWIASSMRLTHTMLIELFQEKSLQVPSAEDLDDLEEAYCHDDGPHMSHVWKEGICPGE